MPPGDPADPHPAPQGHRWGIPEALIGFVAGLVLASLLAEAAASICGYDLSSSLPRPLAVTAFDLVGLWAGLLGAVWYAGHRWGSGRLSLDYGLVVGRWWDLPLGAAAGVASQYLLVPALYLPFRAADPSLNQQLGRPAQTDTSAVHSLVGIGALFLLLAVCAPIVEELFFRGLLMRGLLGRFHPALAVIATALLFALAHFEAVQFAGLALFGVVLALLAWRTGRLGPSIAAHVAFNAVAVAATVHLG